MALVQNYYQTRWQEVETVTALALEVLWGWDSPTANLPSRGFEIEQDDI